MSNVQAIIDLSEELYLSLSSVGLTREKLVQESKKLLALKFYKGKILSLGKAADLSGLSKWEFIDYLGENDVPVINYDEDELKREFQTSDRLKGKLKK